MGRDSEEEAVASTGSLSLPKVSLGHPDPCPDHIGQPAMGHWELQACRGRLAEWGQHLGPPSQGMGHLSSHLTRRCTRSGSDMQKWGRSDDNSYIQGRYVSICRCKY